MSLDTIHGLVYATPLTPAAQAAFVEVRSLHETLASNEVTELEKSIWYEMYSKKPQVTAAVASYLVGRPLDDERIEFVLKNETRVSVVSGLLYANKLNPEQMLQAIALKKIGGTLAEILCKQYAHRDPSLDASVRVAVAKAAGIAPHAELLAESSDTTEQDVRDLFSHPDFGSRMPTGAKASLTRLLYCFPAVLDVCLAKGAKAPLLQLACGSVHLRTQEMQDAAIDAALALSEDHGQYQMLALANLPFATESTLDRLAQHPQKVVCESVAARRQKKRPTVTTDLSEVTDPAVISWLVKRCLPSRMEGSYTPAKAHELCDLVRNPNLGVEHALSMGTALLTDYGIEETFTAAERNEMLGILEVILADVQWRDKFRTVHEDEDTPVYRVRASRPRVIGQVNDSDTGCDALVIHLRNNFPTQGVTYMATRDLTTPQWRMVIELAPMMLNITVGELASLVSTY